MAVQIRLARESDANAFVEIYRPAVESAAISFETVAPNRVEMAGRIVDTLRSYPWLTCERGGRVAGYAYATEHRARAAYRWSVDASVYVAPDHRRSGVGRGLYVSLFRILEAQGYCNAYAGIALPNAPSVALHEAVGFTKIGVYRRVGYKLGAWHDVGWWQLQLREHEDAPGEPLELAAVCLRPDWRDLLATGESAIRRE